MFVSLGLKKCKKRKKRTHVQNARRVHVRVLVPFHLDLWTVGSFSVYSNSVVLKSRKPSSEAGMVAANTPLHTPPSGPATAHHPSTTLSRHCSSNPFARFRPKPLPDPAAALLLSHRPKMDLPRRVAAPCFGSRRSKGLKVDPDFGGQEIFYADAKAAPEHLVIMVNGLIGRYSLIQCAFFVLWSLLIG